MVAQRRAYFEAVISAAQSELDRLDQWGVKQLAMIERDMAISVGEIREQ